MAGILDQYLAQLKALVKKITSYFSSLPQKDPWSMYSWIGIGVGIVLIAASFFF